MRIASLALTIVLVVLSGCSTATTVSCVRASDCASGTTCIGGTCMTTQPCASSRSCPGLVCNTTTGACAECNTAADCDHGDPCELGVCVPPAVACTSDRDCSTSGLVCDATARHCVECVATTDCDPGHVCIASACILGDGAVVQDGGPATPDAGSDAGADAALSLDAGRDALASPDAGLCVHDADCSDGAFCDGVERCTHGAGADAHGCVAGIPPCAAASCDEAADRCMACDADFDGANAIGCGGTDCNDDDPNIHPGATELCDGVDSNCSGDTEDADADGYAANDGSCMGGPIPATDCNDHDASVHPGVTERCNGRDDDCDGIVDDPPAGAECASGMTCFAGACSTATGGYTGVSAGGVVTCAIRAAGDAYCWGGQATYGQLGDGGPDHRALPGPAVNSLVDGATLVAGANTVCVIRTGGGVVCWGYDSWGQAGDGTSTFALPTPHAVLGLGGHVLDVGGGVATTCVLLTSGDVQCFGLDRDGEIGDGTIMESHPTPAYVIGASNIRHLGSGGYHFCAARADRAVLCWGANDGGQIGTGSTGAPVPTAHVVAGVSADEVGANNSYSCARDGGRVLCWGAVPGAASPWLTPTVVPGISDAVELAVGEGVNCVRHATGEVSCWGMNNRGQLGVGTTSTTPTTTPTTRCLVSRMPCTSRPAVSTCASCARRTTSSVGERTTSVSSETGP